MYGYRLNEPSGSHKYGTFPVENPAKYSSDVYGRKAVRIVRQQAKRPGPFYLQVEFLAPHVETVPLKKGFVPQSWADVDDPERDPHPPRDLPADVLADGEAANVPSFGTFPC